jgi:hypothetical protein
MQFLQEPHGINIPEDGILHSYRCENLKSCIIYVKTGWKIAVSAEVKEFQSLRRDK